RCTERRRCQPRCERPRRCGGRAVDAPPDAQTCFGNGLVSLCLAAAPTSPLTITANTTIDTDTSPLCVAYSADTGETALCVVAATTVSVASNRRLRANGSKPL